MNFGDSCWSKVPNHARRFNRVPAGDSVSFVFQVGLGFGSLVFCWNGGKSVGEELLMQQMQVLHGKCVIELLLAIAVTLWVQVPLIVMYSPND